MPVTITITGNDAGHARAELIGLAAAYMSAPPVSDVSSDIYKPVADAVRALVEQKTADEAPKPRGRKPKAEIKLPEGPALNISTGEERVDPETVATITPEMERIEKEGDPAEEAKVFTIDDVRNAATPYIKKHTMAMAQLDLQDCLEAAVGIRQISKLNTADQAQLKKAVEAFEAAGKVETRFVKAA